MANARLELQLKYSGFYCLETGGSAPATIYAPHYAPQINGPDNENLHSGVCRSGCFIFVTQFLTL